jgi:hypothetical protein
MFSATMLYFVVPITVLTLAIALFGGSKRHPRGDRDAR